AQPAPGGGPGWKVIPPLARFDPRPGEPTGLFAQDPKEVQMTPTTPARTSDEIGHSIPLSLPRRLICDMLHFASRVPTVPVQREMNLSPLCERRRCLADAPGWCALFAKAFGIVARRFPELRRAYLSFPYPRLYQHPISI